MNEINKSQNSTISVQNKHLSLDKDFTFKTIHTRKLEKSKKE